MVTQEIKEQIIKLAIDYLLKNKDIMSYELLNDLFSGKVYIDELTTAATLTAATAIVHNIPVKDKDTRFYVTRLCKECYIGLLTFVKANRQEKFVVKFSANGDRFDLASGRVLPSLKFLNTNYDYLIAGLGKSEPDLIDLENEITYEVKSNYKKNGSVSSMHDANQLVDCDGTHIVIYPVLYDGSINFNKVLYRFPNVIPESELIFSHAINEELLNVVKSGELIPEIEKKLKEENFEWNP